MNSDDRQGPGLGVRSDLQTPGVRARGGRERGGEDGLTEKDWGRITENEGGRTGRAGGTGTVATLQVKARCETYTSRLSGQTQRG